MKRNFEAKYNQMAENGELPDTLRRKIASILHNIYSANQKQTIYTGLHKIAT